MIRFLLLTILICSSAFADSPLDKLIHTREKVKMSLWNDGIQKPKILKIKDISNYALPSEIIVPLQELED